MADLVSISRSPDRSFLMDFGSPPIPITHFSTAKGDFRDISLSGSDRMKNRECVAVSSMFGVGKTRPLPGDCILGSICTKKTTSSWRDSPPPRNTTREAVCQSSGKN
ncbi:hypothetical protein TNCV_1198781 [Trichonephila clavipes]|uniref:Uncharacterized protein n=1 Tax=Trichonephila clavipes TaxID=2585209 RepID=A0A8X6VFF7_TRICX|nr:hypothetical protein TNCV_1198781 [Trichonephila clavipes]